jgi:hypothetical protein
VRAARGPGLSTGAVVVTGGSLGSAVGVEGGKWMWGEVWGAAAAGLLVDTVVGNGGS